MIFKDVEERVGKSKYGRCVLTFAVDDGIAYEGKMCPIDKCHAIKKEESFRRFCHVGRLEGEARG